MNEKQRSYLAGVLDATPKSRRLTVKDELIKSASHEWIEYLAKTYGGWCRPIYDGNRQTPFWGWYLTEGRRQELVSLVRVDSHHIHESDWEKKINA